MHTDTPSSPDNPQWLALVVGNSRLHWGFFEGFELQNVWHTPHLSQKQVHHLWNQGFQGPDWPIPAVKNTLPLWIASVVCSQLALWQDYPVHVIQRDQVPLKNLYPTLGLDRALCLLGAGVTYGWPSLVIDAGTALTYTAGVNNTFWGGAIVPGLLLQVRALSSQTDALPTIELPQEMLPHPWANTTEEAIQSGILYTQLAGICHYVTNWQQLFPTGNVFLTGGDGERLLHFLNQFSPTVGHQIRLDPHLMFWGTRACWNTILRGS